VNVELVFCETLLFHGVNASFEALLLCLCLAETKKKLFLVHGLAMKFVFEESEFNGTCIL
jgi:hypothetical protein